MKKEQRNAVAIVILSIAGFGLCVRFVGYLESEFFSTDEQTVTGAITPGKTRPPKILDPIKIELKTKALLAARLREKTRIAYDEMFNSNMDAKFPAGVEKLKTLFVALWYAEASFRTDKPGKAGEIGGLQITAGFWQDACEYSGAGGPEWNFSIRKNPESIKKSIWICWWYWNRYCPEALAANDWETLIRVHNGGPKGMRKPCTIPAWKKFQEKLAEIGGVLPDKSTSVESLTDGDLSGGEPAKTPPGIFQNDQQTPITPKNFGTKNTETEWD